jgi:hypothetical protein
VAKRTFELEATLVAPPDAVIDFLLDLSRHRGLHPYLQSAVVIQTGSGEEGTWSRWRVIERPRLGPLRYTIRFPARMTRTTATSMVGLVHAAPGCDLTTTTRATLVDGKTVVSESTTVTAPLPLVGYMTSQAHLAHARTFSLLAAELES